MDKEKLNQFYKKNKELCLGLNHWLLLKAKDFKLIDALDAIYRAADGKETAMSQMIIQLIEKNKTRGRSQVYHTDSSQHMDIVRGEDGVLTVTGFNPDKEPRPTGMKQKRNPQIFKKSDGQVKKTVQKTEDRLFDIGEEVRKLFPDADVDFLAKAIDAVSKYAALKKKKPIIIINRIKNNRLYLDKNTFELKPTANEGRTVIIMEEVFESLSNKLLMTDYVFESNIRQFLKDLYNDPVNAQPSETLLVYNLNRNKLIRLLMKYGILTKSENVSFKDENGNFKTPRMKIRYGLKDNDKEVDLEVKKKRFQSKVRKLYIDLFEKNVPQNVNEEEGGGSFISGGGDGAGQFITKLGTKPLKQKSYLEQTNGIDEATTTAINITYDLPVFGDEESLDRKGGKNHSVSINFK